MAFNRSQSTCPTTWGTQPGRRAGVLRENTSHCFEGAIFAAAALRANGFPPLILDFEAERDTDHVIAVYRIRGRWGSIAKSNYASCRYREPVYRSLRELAMSYFDTYFNTRRNRTMRSYCRTVDLKRFDDQQWMTTEKPIWFIVYYLLEIHHYKLLWPGGATPRGPANLPGGDAGQGVQSAEKIAVRVGAFRECPSSPALRSRTCRRGRVDSGWSPAGLAFKDRHVRSPWPHLLRILLGGDSAICETCDRSCTTHADRSRPKVTGPSSGWVPRRAMSSLVRCRSCRILTFSPA